MEEAIRRGLRIPGTISDVYNPYLDGVTKGSLESFHEYLTNTLPKGWTAEPAHIKLIAEHLDAVDRGQIDRLAISMPPRHGKPVWVESMVLMGNGSRKRIKDIKIGDEVITHLGRPRKVTQIFHQGLLECVEITTSRGRKTIAAKTHPFLTTEGWVNAGDLSTNMRVVHLAQYAYPIEGEPVLTEVLHFDDQVASVTSIGQLECMCLTVEEDHTFTSDDFIVHNTETTTVRYGAYAFERNPRDNVLVTAYNERIARRFSRKARAIVETRRQLMTSSRAADEWGLPEGGTFMSRGVGSPPTGVGFKRIIIDDPIRKREDAESVNLREKAWDWFTDDIYTRLEPGGAMIIVATRWHHDDIISRAIDSEANKWVVLKLPAIAEEADQLGRQPGESLWPERYSVEDLMRIKAVMLQNEGEYGWQALYQQSPTQRSGAMIRQDRISTFAELPMSVGRFRRVVRAWDLASTRGAGDYTVGVKGALDNIGRFWILDVVIGQFDVDERDNIIYRTAEMDGKDVTIRLPQDPAQAGKSQARYLLRMLHGYRVSILSPSGSKTLRAEPFAAQVNNFNVNMIAAAWNQPVLDEFRQFPMGRHDDIVDATVDCYDECTKKRTMSFA
jgi:predicted phage terminase large subunit-like protein